MRPDIIRDKVRAMFKKRTSGFPFLPKETESRDDRLKRIGIVDSKTTDNNANQDKTNDGGSNSEHALNDGGSNSEHPLNDGGSNNEYAPSDGGSNSEHAPNDGGSNSEYAPSVVSPTTISMSRKEKILKEGDCTAFKATFKDLIESSTPIMKVTVKSSIEAKPKLRHLLKENTLLQLADKIRTERKVFQQCNK